MLCKYLYILEIVKDIFENKKLNLNLNLLD